MSAPAADREMPDFEPIHQLRAHEYVAEQIRRHISLRLIASGESLPPERELAAMFAVGRPTIQHALRLLEADRLVDTRRGRHGGSFVAAPEEDQHLMDELIARLQRDRHQLAELIVFRRTIEPAVAGLAASTRRKADIAALWRLAEELGRTESEADYLRRDTALHLAIARATRNSFLVRSIEDVRMGINDALLLLPSSEVWLAGIADEHTRVIAAIEDADAAGARAAMDVHVGNADQALRAALTAMRRRASR